MSGIHDVFESVALSDEHLTSLHPFPIKVVAKLAFSEGSKEVIKADSEINNNKYETGASAFRCLKKGAKKDTSAFDQKVKKLIVKQDEINKLKIAAGYLVRGALYNNFDPFNGWHIDSILDRASHFLSKKVELDGFFGCASLTVTDVNYYGKRLKEVQKSATKSCGHCKKRFKTADLTMLHIVACAECRTKHPFDTATEEKKRSSMEKVIAKKEEDLKSQVNALLLKCPYIYTVKHSYPDNETDTETYNGLYR